VSGLFVTGTDTGVGKTLAACALVHALASRGVRAGVMKPIAAGGTGDRDALMLAAGLGAEWRDTVTPILLREAIAPHIAAALERRAITWPPIEGALARLRSSFGHVVVEGVGGFHVPLGDDWDTEELARRVGLPVVLVVGMRLGCLNHALLTAKAIERTGLPLRGWIASCIVRDMPYRDENIAALESRLGAPRLGTIPYMQQPDPVIAARSLAAEALA